MVRRDSNFEKNSLFVLKKKKKKKIFEKNEKKIQGTKFLIKLQKYIFLIKKMT